MKGGKKGQEIFRGCLKLTNVVQDHVELKKIILNDRALWEEFRKNYKMLNHILFHLSVFNNFKRLINEANTVRIVMYKEPKQPFYVEIL